MPRLQNPWSADRSINKRSPYGWRVHPITRSLTVGAGLTSFMTTSGNFKITTFTAGTGTVTIS